MAKIKVHGFKNTSGVLNGFHYMFEKNIEPGKEVVVKMPSVTANKRSINEIAWQSDSDVTLYGTLSKDYDDDKKAMWQEISEDYDVNKCVTALKFVGGADGGQVIVRVIMC